MWNEMASYIKRVAKEVFLENIKDVSDKLRRLDGSMRRLKQQLD